MLAAPAGDRVDVPGETHDTIAVYDLMFETPGVYTAYYRARGLNAAANSMYSPDGFDVDPDNQQTLSDNGSFAWVKDAQTFEITASNVGVPLEFRLGMREELSQLDALVLEPRRVHDGRGARRDLSRSRRATSTGTTRSPRPTGRCSKRARRRPSPG